jgi:hypothetical protein
MVLSDQRYFYFYLQYGYDAILTNFNENYYTWLTKKK